LLKIKGIYLENFKEYIEKTTLKTILYILGLRQRRKDIILKKKFTFGKKKKYFTDKFGL